MFVHCDWMGDSPEQYDQAMRAQRNAFLSSSDWTQVADAPVDREAWAVYRQALRDAPSTWTPGPTWDAPEPPA
jgi:hypothetical protein